MTDFKYFADLGQRSIETLYATDDIMQGYNNVYPLTDPSQNDVFNYWWIAHLVDLRVDGYLRTHQEQYLDQAQQTYHHNKHRNHDSLRHNFYDDMLWNALAALRLFNETHKPEYLCDAQSVCDDILHTAWNDTMDGGFAWTRKHLFYKNTPVNAPFMILAIRLYQLSHDRQYLEASERTLAWMQSHLINSQNGFVEDGINRNQDGKIDTQWQFSYYQGIYIGALIEFFNVTGNPDYLRQATQTAKTSIHILGQSGVIHDEGDGGDIGLFKGILYRYMAQLVTITRDNELKQFILNSAEILLQHAVHNNQLLANRNWLIDNGDSSVLLADELSAVMAVESAVVVSNQ